MCGTAPRIWVSRVSLDTRAGIILEYLIDYPNREFGTPVIGAQKVENDFCKSPSLFVIVI